MIKQIFPLILVLILISGCSSAITKHNAPVNADEIKPVLKTMNYMVYHSGSTRGQPELSNFISDTESLKKFEEWIEQLLYKPKMDVNLEHLTNISLLIAEYERNHKISGRQYYLLATSGDRSWIKEIETYETLDSFSKSDIPNVILNAGVQNWTEIDRTAIRQLLNR